MQNGWNVESGVTEYQREFVDICTIGRARLPQEISETLGSKTEVGCSVNPRYKMPVQIFGYCKDGTQG